MKLSLIVVAVIAFGAMVTGAAEQSETKLREAAIKWYRDSEEKRFERARKASEEYVKQHEDAVICQYEESLRSKNKTTGGKSTNKLVWACSRYPDGKTTWRQYYDNGYFLYIQCIARVRGLPKIELFPNKVENVDVNKCFSTSDIFGPIKKRSTG